MTTATESRSFRLDLDNSLQILIDTRLDTIDRILMGRVPRADRLSILREVESQIEELISKREPETVGREEILEILGRIDPPEAYLPEEIGDVRGSLPRVRSQKSFTPPNTSPPPGPGARMGLLGGIFGLATLGMTIILGIFIWGITITTGAEWVFLLGMILVGFLGLAGSVCGLIFGIIGRNQGAMPIIGIVSSALALVISLCLPVLGFLLIS